MTPDTTPDWDTIAEQEIESRRDEMDTGSAIGAKLADQLDAALEDLTRLLAWWERGRPDPLCINGREYARRQRARRGRKH